MKLPRPAQYFSMYWGAGETTEKKVHLEITVQALPRRYEEIISYATSREMLAKRVTEVPFHRSTRWGTSNIAPR